MISIVAYKIAVIVLVAGIVGASGTAVYYHDQQGTQISKAADLNTQIASLQSQIDSLNSQISKLNTQVSQLQTLNNQLGGNNSQLISQITQLNSQLSQYKDQVSGLQAQVTSLSKIIGLQNSRVIANSVCIFWDCPTGNGGNIVGNHVFIDLGQILYSGYVRVSWTGAHVSFTEQVFDVNVTTPIGGSGVYSVPVSANVTGSAWFTGYDCSPVPAGTFCPPVTYSATYWY
jgi:regulator of replication initiation timing